ncbi:hypothetical protein TWF225_007631 [Orbilia oligospora]|uniref:Glycolipid transfer protein domain-containing protein n=1 Tax=Orbilia oligospora TaxID=2813651 RepID=A0A6G1LXT5_ORBOL|nr:hypothetical protein TWF103_003424 [Orbilia oligospora]KAF3087154.1 hypothetical protein TWF706_011231 [Orbilia oligospora]KAF3092120.1 hypothetical protein TWF102_008529 [Orbilia oligospora]KAF3179097.1 hypothetical protein TWF225_007631 [Orbilia oligospora]KAF3200725.1 hypothetical protein TWF106_003165 [Orbilia oligospora]
MSSSDAQTFIAGVKVSFKDVPTTPGVDTVSFLGASESLVGLFDILGSTSFGPVKSDLNGNIAKLQKRYDAAKEKSGTLQELVLAERAEKKKDATEGLVWLLRGLDFTAKGIRHNLDNPTEELATSFQHAYDGTLKQYHNFVVKGIFSVAMKATPYRKDFYPKVGDEASIKEWLEALEKNVSILQNFYDTTPEAKF